MLREDAIKLVDDLMALRRVQCREEFYKDVSRRSIELELHGRRGGSQHVHEMLEACSQYLRGLAEATVDVLKRVAGDLGLEMSPITVQDLQDEFERRISSELPSLEDDFRNFARTRSGPYAGDVPKLKELGLRLIVAGRAELQLYCERALRDLQTSSTPDAAWGRPAVFMLLATMALGVTVAALLPINWSLRVVSGVILGVLLVPFIARFSPQINSLVDFLVEPPRPLPRQISWAHLTTPASNHAVVFVEDLAGNFHPSAALLTTANARGALEEVARSSRLPVKSVRAVIEGMEVARWRPSLAQRVRMALTQRGPR